MHTLKHITYIHILRIIYMYTCIDVHIPCFRCDVLHVGPKGSTAPFGVDLGAVPGKTAKSSHGPFGHRAKAGALENLETAGDFHGFSWIFMAFHGFSWILMGF